MIRGYIHQLDLCYSRRAAARARAALLALAVRATKRRNIMPIMTAMLLLACTCAAAAGNAAVVQQQEKRPAILFCSPYGILRTTNGWLDLTLLRSLHNGSWAHFEVDWTESLDDMNKSRLFKYNAVVLFKSPNSLDSFPPYPNSTRRNFMPLMTEYMEAGTKTRY